MPVDTCVNDATELDATAVTVFNEDSVDVGVEELTVVADCVTLEL